MANAISKLVAEFDRAALTLEAAEMLLAAQIDEHEQGQEALYEHYESSCNLMLDRAIEQFEEVLERLKAYKHNER